MADSKSDDRGFLEKCAGWLLLAAFFVPVLIISYSRSIDSVYDYDVLGLIVASVASIQLLFMAILGYSLKRKRKTLDESDEYQGQG